MTGDSPASHFLFLATKRTRHDARLECPWPGCGSEMVHFAKPLHVQTDAYEAWQYGRGSAVRIPMYCESGHEWTFVVGFHKGCSYLTVEGMTEYDMEPTCDAAPHHLQFTPQQRKKWSEREERADF